MVLAEQLRAAVRAAVNEAITAEVRDAVIRETRIALQAHEAEFAAIIRSAVVDAIGEMFTPG